MKARRERAFRVVRSSLFFSMTVPFLGLMPEWPGETAMTPLNAIARSPTSRPRRAGVTTGSTGTAPQRGEDLFQASGSTSEATATSVLTRSGLLRGNRTVTLGLHL